MYIGRGNKIREAGKKEADISVHYSDSGFGYCLYGFERLLEDRVGAQGDD